MCSRLRWHVNKREWSIGANTERGDSAKRFKRDHGVVAVCGNKLQRKGITRTRVGNRWQLRRKPNRKHVQTKFVRARARDQCDVIRLASRRCKPEFMRPECAVCR